jgi:phospholipid transport system substrate-binding protein
MINVRSSESLLSQNPTIFARHACRLVGLMALAGVLTLGTLPVSAQTGVTEALPLPAVAPLGPLELVKSSLSRVLTIVQSQSASATQAGKRRAEIRQAAVEMFDFDDMSRRILAQHWKDGSPQEQEEFVRLFTELLERAYLTSIGTYPLASITFQDESINGAYAQVRSRMSGGRGGNVAIEYRLFESDGRWAVYDVAVDGISLISSYRSQFNSILRRSSFAELLQGLQNREASVAPPGQNQAQ